MLEPAISVVMPALNEAENIELAVGNALAAFDDLDMKGEVVVINDGSTDATPALVVRMQESEPRVRLVNHDTPQGIGASFWDGVDNAVHDCVLMLPGDNENDPWEIFRYVHLMRDVDIVIPFVFNKQTRSLFRNVLSFTYRFIINNTFLVNFNYTNGTIIYRTELLKELDSRSDSFFFQTDILIRLVKQGYLFAEVPYRLGLRPKGVSKAVSFPSLIQVMKGYLRLVKDSYGFARHKEEHVPFHAESQTASRHSEGPNPLLKTGIPENAIN